MGIINIVRVIAYSVTGLIVRKGWNWLTADVDPIPGTKEFDDEYRQVRSKYLRLRKRKEMMWELLILSELLLIALQVSS